MALAGLAGRLPPGVRKALKTVPGATRIRDWLYHNPQASPFPPGTLRPVVYLPTWLRWEVMRQRPQYLLEALAGAGHEVFFVDPRADRITVPSPGVTITPSLRSTPGSEVILYTHFAPTRTLIDRYSDGVVVYDILDDLSIYDPDEVGLPAERTVRHHHGPLMARADVVIASNTVLVERHLSERPDMVLIENGVDPTLFTPVGSGVALGDAPVVGYHGAIGPWFDFEMLAQLAEGRPGYRFVLVGPLLEGTSEGAESLAAFPNVTHFPEKPAVEVAAYVRSFDVGLIPFLVNEMTEGVTPLKLYEYLASGVPVVSTPLPACVAHPDVVVGVDRAGLLEAIDAAVALDPAARSALRASGEAASWSRRIEPLLERLESLGVRETSRR